MADIRRGGIDTSGLDLGFPEQVLRLNRDLQLGGPGRAERGRIGGIQREGEARGGLGAAIAELNEARTRWSDPPPIVQIPGTLDPQPRDTVRRLLYRGTPGTSDTLLYTSPNFPGARTELSRLVVANTNDSAITFRLHAVPKGGSSGVTNALFYDVSVAANATVIHDVRGLVLEEGEMLRALQQAASKICLTITGVQEVRVGGVQ